jgi:hypothetical protein
VQSNSILEFVGRDYKTNRLVTFHTHKKIPAETGISKIKMTEFIASPFSLIAVHRLARQW